MQLSQLYAYVLARYYCSGSHHWRFVRPSGRKVAPLTHTFINALYGKTRLYLTSQTAILTRYI